MRETVGARIELGVIQFDASRRFRPGSGLERDRDGPGAFGNLLFEAAQHVFGFARNRRPDPVQGLAFRRQHDIEIGEPFPPVTELPGEPGEPLEKVQVWKMSLVVAQLEPDRCVGIGDEQL